MDVDIPAGVEAPDLATDADLKPAPESIVAPIGDTDIGDTAQNYARRRDAGVRTPGKGAGKGIGDRIKSTGTSKGKSIGEQTTGNGEGNDTLAVSYSKSLMILSGVVAVRLLMSSLSSTLLAVWVTI